MDTYGSLAVPSETWKKSILKEFIADLESYTIVNPTTGEILPVHCCICDSIPPETNWYTWIGIDCLRRLCKGTHLEKSHIAPYYEAAPGLVEQYTVADTRLEEFVLSPTTYICSETDSTIICKECKAHMETNSKKRMRNARSKPPPDAIANGFLIGEAPEELKVLNEVELSLVSKVRIYSHTWIFFGGCHRHIKGWHTFFKNRNVANVESLNLLQTSGLKGQILVALCGPFTSTQKALTHQKCSVDPKKVIAAHEWLRKNNFYYSGDPILSESDIPLPMIIEDDV